MNNDKAVFFAPIAIVAVSGTVAWFAWAGMGGTDRAKDALQTAYRSPAKPSITRPALPATARAAETAKDIARLTSTSPAKPSGKIVATVNGQPIYESELLAGLPQDAFADTLEELKERKLEGLINETVQLQFLADRKIAVSEDDLNKGLQDFEKTVTATAVCSCCGGGYASLAEYMDVNSVTMSDLRRRVSCNIGLKLYAERLVKEQNTPQALAAAVKANRAQIEAEYVNAYAISFDNVYDPQTFGDEKAKEARKAKLAAEALARLKKGESFEKVAQAMSEDKASAAKGGALGCVRTDFLGQDVAKVLSNLQPGSYSDVIKQWGCYYIVMKKKMTDEDILNVAKNQVVSRTDEQVDREVKAAIDGAKIENSLASASRRTRHR